MDIVTLVRDAWRITWKNWQLWAVHLGLFLISLPVFVISGGFGGVAGLLVTPIPGPAPLWLRSLRQIPDPMWVGIALGALLLLVITTTLSWICQAAAMRGVALAVEKGAFSLAEAFNLGRQRVSSLLKLSLTFGVLIAAFGLLPILFLILLGPRLEAARTLYNAVQGMLAPINTVLGLMLLIVMMSIALEDLRPRAAFRRGWQVFAKGWWAFLFVFGIAFGLGFAAALVSLIALGALIIPGILLLTFEPRLAAALAGVGGLCFLPIFMVCAIFVAVFTVVLYTLTYRQAAQSLAA